MTEMTEAQYPIQLVARPTGLSAHVIRIGASLPAAEIAGSAQHRRARAVALSLVFTRGEPGLTGELTPLRKSLPAGVDMLAGGRAMPAYRDVLEKIGALPI